MRGVRSPRWALVALAVGLVAGAFGAGVVPEPAPAASAHRAAVIVDTGAAVKRVVVTFGEDSITGIDALQRAGMDPVVYQFGGQGGAVCRLLGVGRDAGPNCLGGGDGDARYWGYFRAPAGSSSFTYSSVGAGTTRVHDGDVEGWKFGTGTPPPYASLASLLPPPAPPSPPPPTAPPATSAGAGGAPAGATGTAAGVAASGPVPTSTTLPVTGGEDASTTTRAAGKPDGGADASTDGERASQASRDGDGKAVDTALASSESGGAGGGGGSAWSLVLFAFLMVAIVVAILVARRVRRHAGTG
jgi:hypothetical protein